VVEQDYLNTHEAGEFLRRSPAAIRNLVLRRMIPYRKPGGRLLFSRSELERWVEDASGVSFEEIQNERR